MIRLINNGYFQMQLSGKRLFMSSQCTRIWTHTSFPQFYFRILHDWAFSSNGDYLPQGVFYYNHNNVILY